MTRVVLHIDRLVLRGVAREEACTLEEALRSALLQQLEAPDAAVALAARPSTALLLASPILPTSDSGMRAQARAAGQAIAGQLIPGVVRPSS